MRDEGTCGNASGYPDSIFQKLRCISHLCWAQAFRVGRGHKPSPIYEASSAGWALSEFSLHPSPSCPMTSSFLSLRPTARAVFWVGEPGPRTSSTTGEPQCPLQHRLQGKS